MLKYFIFFCFFSSLPVLANATVYQFTGIVDSTIGPDVPFNVGDSMSFTIEIDFSSPGYLTLSGSSASAGPNTYAAEYIAGDAVTGVGWDGWTEHYYWDNTAGNTGSINVLNNLSISSAVGYGGVQYWNALSSISFSQDWHTSGTGEANNIYGHITNVTSVPAPAAAWLFGPALIALTGIKRKKLQNS